MKFDKIYKKIEDHFRGKFKEIVSNGDDISDDVFSDSERQDIMDMIESDMTFDQIIDMINKWNLD